MDGGMPPTPQPRALLLGDRAADHLVLSPLRRAHPDATDFWEANWLKVDVAVRAGAFHGAFVADLRTDELQAFGEQLAALEGAPEGAAGLESMEGWVSIQLTLGPGGRVRAACELRDDPASGGALRFDLTTGPAQVAAWRDGLAELLRAFPVVGEEAEGADLLPLDDQDPERDPDQRPS